MARYGSADFAFMLVGGRSLLASVVTQVDEDHEGVTEQANGLGDPWRKFLGTGAQMASLKQQGFYDDVANGENDALNGQQLTQQIVSFGLSGNVIGKNFIGYNGAFGLKYNRVPVLNGLTKATADYTITGQRDEGQILHPATSESSSAGDTTATSVDNTLYNPGIAITSSSVANPSILLFATPHNFINGDLVLIAGHSGSTPAINGMQTVTVIDSLHASIPVNVTVGGTGGTATRGGTNNGAVGYLQMPALVLGGWTNSQIKIRHSADNSSWADLITFAVVTVAPNAQRIVVAGLVNRYTSMSWAYNGAGAGQSVSPVVGFART